MRRLPEILIYVAIAAFILIMTFFTVYRALWQDCDSMAGWSTNVPARCIQERR